MVNNRPKIKKTRNSQASMEDSDHQSPQSGALIGSNDDLLTEILLRLPAESILRFKSVSKHWHLLLSDPHFTHRYDKLSKSPGLFAENKYVPFDVENPNPPPSLRSLASCFKRSGVQIVQSCNGLLLCTTDRGPKGCKDADKYYVFNPTTKQLANIPPVPGGVKVSKSIRFMGLAFHQTDCVHYKVVCIRSLDNFGASFQIQIYSSDASKWKISIQSFAASLPVVHRGVYWDGGVYWAPHCSNSDFLYFKIDEEQLQTLPLPLGLMSSEIVTMYFGESRGHLHLIVYKKHAVNILNLNVYEMSSDRSGWFVKYQVELDELQGAFREMNSPYGFDFKVIDVVRGEEEEDAFIMLVTPKKMIRYNVHDKGFKQILSFNKYYCHHIFSFHRYTETLSSF